MRHVRLFLLLTLTAALVVPLAAAPPAERPAKDLDDGEVEILVDTAAKVRAGLDELRQLAAVPENAARRAELQKSVRQDLATFLETAGLTPADFVRLLDQDGLSNGKDDDAKPVLRALEKAER